MALVLADRVQETSTTTGTGTLTLDGASSGYQTFSAGIGNGNTCYYTIQSDTGAWEVGVGTVGAATLARTTLISSSTGGAVSFSGTLTVFVTYPAEKAVYGESTTLVAPSGALLPVASGGTGIGTLTGYVKGSGTSAMTASATIPNTDITGLGTMSTQAASAVAITGGTIADTSITVADNVFTLQDNLDPTKQAQFQLSGLLTGTTYVFTLPTSNGGASTLVDLNSAQTISASKTFTGSANIFGSSSNTYSVSLGVGATASGNTKTVNIGTGGLSGSTTNIAIGSSVSGATSTTLLSGTITTTAYTETIVASGTVGASATLAITAGTVLTATLTSATACTFTMPTATAGKSFTLLLKQPAAGTPTTATFTGVKWNSGGAPTITATLGRLDIIAFVADGTNWYGTASQGYTY